MLKHIDNILAGFRNCFAETSAYKWFIVIVAGFIIRLDHYGVSSFIRWLFLDPSQYNLLLHFFRTDSWCLTALTAQWITLAIRYYPVPEFNGRILLIGDGIKVSREAKMMPGVKKLRQDSENSGKGEYIFGHHFNAVGLLTGCTRKLFCTPLLSRLAEGTEGFREDEGIDEHPASIITRMAHLIVQAAEATGRLCYVALDRYFSTGPMFRILKNAVNEKGERLVHAVIGAKRHYVVYIENYNVPGKFKEKNKIPLTEWFDYPNLFEKVTIEIGGKAKTVECYAENFLWKPVGELLRFVFIRDGEEEFILMSTDLTLPAPDIITIYLYRHKIETMFLMLKHTLGGFCSRFWTKYFPATDRGKQPDFSGLPAFQQKKLAEAAEATERFVNIAGIALGLLQYLAISYPSKIWSEYEGWLRTCSSEIPSEGVVQSVIQAEFFSSLGKVPDNRTLRFIRKKMRKCLINKEPPLRDTG